MQIRSHTAEELQEHARSLVGALQIGQHATLVTLSGELGAGKTTFTQGVAKAVGVTEIVTSPTFVIEKIYTLEGQRWERLVHIDAYRLNDPHELEVLGWSELLLDKGNLILLEWPERITPIIPNTAIQIRIDIDGDGRIITQYGSEETKGN